MYETTWSGAPATAPDRSTPATHTLWSLFGSAGWAGLGGRDLGPVETDLEDRDTELLVQRELALSVPVDVAPDRLAESAGVLPIGPTQANIANSAAMRKIRFGVDERTTPILRGANTGPAH